MDINNPVARLHKIIRKGKKEAVNQKTSHALANIFDLDADNKSQLLLKVGEIMSLPQSIRSEVGKLENIDNDLLLKWLPPVETSMSTINFQSKWGSFIEQYKDDVMYGMELCSDILKRNRPEKTIADQSRTELLIKINQIIESLESEDIPKDLKKFLFDRLSRIRGALESYIVLGITPLELELESLGGAVAANRDIYNDSKETKTGTDFWILIGRIALITNIVVGTAQIANEIANAFSTGESNTMEGVFEPREEIQMARLGHENDRLG